MSNTIAPVLRPGKTEADIAPLFAGRWSSRAIDSEKPIDNDVLKRLFEAARWAPSAFNNQPWRFLSFGHEDPSALEKAKATLTGGNAWALAAPRLLFVLTRSDRPGNGKPNVRAEYEAGMAALQMGLQAAEEGLVFHQMAGFSIDAVRKSFDVPDNFAIITAVAIGWPGSIENVPENRRKMETDERERMPYGNLVFSNGQVPSA